ncbi:MAG: hypothetical protein JO112_06075 [Planctomycetes bacterium]|nr:hypothetical protein [Planctomycetota bacterium]
MKDGFVPIRDAEGNVRGLMDRATADYLASQAPDPTQASLNALLADVTRVRVVSFASLLQGVAEQKVLLDTSDPLSLIAFRNCLAIVEDPDTFGHCMCCGDPHLQLYAGDRLLATLGYHHGFAIRWDAWKHDAVLKEPDRLLDWMTAHGVHGPRGEVDESRRRAEESARQAECWLRAMPTCLRPFWEEMDNHRDPALHRRLLEALRASSPSPADQALTLFGWLGSGVGPWSGYPSYESVPLQLLLYYPTQLLVKALTASEPTASQIVGAARYFADWDFRQTKKGDSRLLPAELKQRLLEAAAVTGIADNVARARKAYAG